MSTPRSEQLCIDKTAVLSQVLQKAADLQEAISEGATSFLLTEFKYMGVFMVSSSPRQHVLLLSMLFLRRLASLLACAPRIVCTQAKAACLPWRPDLFQQQAAAAIWCGSQALRQAAT